MHSEWTLVGAEQMRALDQYTIQKLGVPDELLMESAGRLIAAAALEERHSGGRVLCVCGPGNNGGDGFVAARHLHQWGVPVEIVLVAERARLQGAAARNFERAEGAGVPLGEAQGQAAEGDVVIDALFGTGLAREVVGPAADAVRWIDAQSGRVRIVAADLPSGLDADTGQVHGVAVRADVTVTLGLPKVGLALEPGRSLAGRVVVGRIGIAESAPGVAVAATLLTRAGAGAALPERPAHGHKGSFGHALIVAGSEGKTGAAALAAEGAIRAGAGLVTVACPASASPILEVKCTEAMTVALPESPSRQLAVAAEEPLVGLARERDAVVLGPGIGREETTAALVRAAVSRFDGPVVLDADALIAYAGQPGSLAACPGALVLTPHPGEAAALLGSTAAALNADRVGAARRLALASEAVVVLKGAGTVIAAPDGRVRVNPTGGPNLATGGTGDVLAGVVGGLLAQGLDAFEAASVGAFLHGAAGDRLAERSGSVGTLAGDIARELPAAAEALRREASAPDRPRAGSGDALAFP
jgi:NAD(P)H-hydrate epimerase